MPVVLDDGDDLESIFPKRTAKQAYRIIVTTNLIYINSV
jgi:hypothetical protein